MNTKKRGGDISTFNLSAGIREVRPGEKEWSDKDYECGFTQQKHDGTFSVILQTSVGRLPLKKNLTN